MSKLIRELVDALNASQKNKTEAFDRSGTVKRIEGRTAWVQLEGSDRETPIQMTIACDAGDTVQARIGGGSAWLTGNLTAPPTDDKKANEAISMVTTVVQEVQEQVEEALEDVSTVDDVTMQYCLSDSSSTFVQYGDWSSTPPTYVSGKYYWTRSVLVDDDGNETYGEPRYSQDTQLSVETSRAYATTNAHFWYDGTGAYVTDSTQTAYKADASNKYATRVTPTGILQSYGGTTLSSWTNSGISFYQGGSTVASFGSTVSIGDFNKLTLDSSGINIAAHVGSWSFAVNGAITPIGTSTRMGLELSSDYALYLAGSSSVQIYVGGTQVATFGSSLLVNNNVGASTYMSGGYKLITTGTVNVSLSVSASSTATGSVSASKTGYIPIGVIGIEASGSSSTFCNVYKCCLSGSSISVGARNMHESNTATLNLAIDVLYVASSQGV